MSSNYRLQVDVVGNTRGFDAAMNRMNQGITRVASGFRKSSQEGGILNRQLQAMGTTARYAFAGGIIFGVTKSLRALNDFQQGLAAISTVATDVTGAQGIGKQMNSLADDIVRASSRSTIAITALQTTVTSLYSSLAQNVSPSAVGKLTNTLARTALVSQVSQPSSLVGPVLGGISAFGLPSDSKHINQSATTVGAYFKWVLQKSRNISGEEFANYSGNLYKSLGQAGFGLPETSALTVLASQYGGTASSIVQNLSQYGQFVRSPNKRVRQAYAEAGITSQDLLSKYAGPIVTQKILAHAKSLGGVKTSKLTGDEIAALPAGTKLTSTGVSGPAADFLSRAATRIQSQRTLAVLASAPYNGKRGFDALSELTKQAGNQAQLIKNFNKGVKDAINQMPLHELANNIAAANINITRGMQNILNPAARGLNVGARALAQHPGVSKAIVYAVEAGLGATLLSRYTPLGKLPGFKMLSGSAGLTARKAVVGEELTAMASGAPADGSRANPFWVIISPLSDYVGAQGGDPAQRPGSGSPTPASSGKKLPSLKKIPIVGIGGAALITAGFGAAGYDYLQSTQGHSSNYAINAKGTLGKKNSIQDFLKQALPSSSWGMREDVAWYAKKNHITPQRIEIHGQAQTDFTIKLTDSQGKQLTIVEKKGVPVRMWGASGMPSSQGKAGTRKGAGT